MCLQFVNVRLPLNDVSAAIIWSKLVQLGVLLAFICQLMTERFHTLKFELDFYSRQGHWTLYWTGVYYRILLTEKQRRRLRFYFFRSVVQITWGNSIISKNRVCMEINSYHSRFHARCPPSLRRLLWVQFQFLRLKVRSHRPGFHSTDQKSCCTWRIFSTGTTTLGSSSTPTSTKRSKRRKTWNRVPWSRTFPATWKQTSPCLHSRAGSF